MGESLWSYISRFNAKVIQVEDLNYEIVCEALNKGIRNIEFVDSLIKNPKATYQLLMEKTQKHIRLDDKVQVLREDKKAN